MESRVWVVLRLQGGHGGTGVRGYGGEAWEFGLNQPWHWRWHLRLVWEKNCVSGELFLMMVH